MAKATKKHVNWVLLRGLVRESRHWAGFEKRLQKAYPKATILTPDTAGNGSRYLQDSPGDISGYIPSLKIELEKAKKQVEGDWYIAGLSMGGMIAMEWMATYPEDFAKGFVMNSSASNLVSMTERLTPVGIASLLGIAAAMDPLQKEDRILKMTASSYYRNKSIISEWANYHQEKPTSARNATRQILACSKFKAPKKIETPLVCLGGAKDRMVSPVCIRRIADYYNAPMELCPDAGHDLTLDNPEWVIDVMQNH